uniref:Uncharacterized protein n=1 Tax=Anguilla anguilla TaxID=7936 RepID=A0A0E9S5N0_ANGAN
MTSIKLSRNKKGPKPTATLDL